jgi:hypothetical protein
MRETAASGAKPGKSRFMILLIEQVGTTIVA